MINRLVTGRVLLGTAMLALVACQTTDAPSDTHADTLLTLHHATIHERDPVFRGTGNEPGWVAELNRQQQLSFVGDYGAFGLQAPAQRQQKNAGDAVQYHATQGEHRLQLIIEERHCQDTMSDQQFPLTVTVQLDERELRGCGWYLD